MKVEDAIKATVLGERLRLLEDLTKDMKGRVFTRMRLDDGGKAVDIPRGMNTELETTIIERMVQAGRWAIAELVTATTNEIEKL